MPKTMEKPHTAFPMSRMGQTLSALSLILCGLSFALGMMPAILFAVFAAAIFPLLLLRASRVLAYAGAGAYLALAFFFGSLPACLFAFGVMLGGFLLALGIKGKEDRMSLAVSLSFSLLVFGAAALASVLFASMTAEGKTEFFPYLTERLDALVSGATDIYHTFFENMTALYEKAGQTVPVPSRAEIHATMMRLFSLAPGWVILALLVFSLLSTYLAELLSLLSDRQGEEPLYARECREFRLGAPLAVLYFAVLIVNFFYRDYTSVVSLVLMNTQTVLVPLFAFGGLSFLPRILRAMRRAENGRAAYRIWFVLFLLLCLFYVQYASLFFGIVYAVFTLKNAIRSRRENG